MRRIAHLALVSVLASSGCALWQGPEAPLPTEGPARPVQIRQPRNRPEDVACERIERIVVYKSQRRLVAECVGGASREFTAALGREPLGPKQRAGDSRTPEGEYRIAGPAGASRFHLFVPIDYPAHHDALAALERGELDLATYARIMRALERGRLPPQSSPLGGGLGLHGEGERWRGDSELLDWTNGCIAVTDDHIEFLAERTPVGTPVIVLP